MIIEDYNLIITDVYSDYEEWNTPRYIASHVDLSLFHNFLGISVPVGLPHDRLLLLLLEGLRQRHWSRVVCDELLLQLKDQNVTDDSG